MTKIDAFASEVHYLDHIAPIWTNMPESIRGTLYSPCEKVRALPSSKKTAVAPLSKDTLTLVSSFRDLRHVRTSLRRIILMEHGAGQTYDVDSSYYAGGPDRHGVVEVLVPNFKAATAHAKRHPNITVTVIGCPRLDLLRKIPPPEEPAVAISHHWECNICPETRSTFPYYKDAYPDLAAAFPTVRGHAHPRAWPMVRAAYEDNGFKLVDTFEEVLREASVYITDNSSTLFEFAATGRPVVVLNAPWYRKSIHHGGRFWEWADVGIQVDDPKHLVAAVKAAMHDADPVKDLRQRITSEIYPFKGESIPRAVGALCRRALNDTVN